MDKKEHYTLEEIAQLHIIDLMKGYIKKYGKIEYLKSIERLTNPTQRTRFRKFYYQALKNMEA